jgi:hypothetical protein
VRYTGTAGTVVNFGKIKAVGNSSYGVFLPNGGAVTNGSTADTSALIAAYGALVIGIALKGDGTVRNFGTISGGTGATSGSYGIYSNSGGTIANGASGSTAALITGSEDAIHLFDAAGVTTTVINYGKISGPGLDAIRELSSGNLTVINSGTLSGINQSVHFGTGNANRLIVHPGASFVGNVIVDSGGSLTIELATGSGTGTISGLGSNFQDFSTVEVDSGAQWTITGSNSLASGTTLTDLGTLTNAGTFAGAGIFTVSGRLSNSGTITDPFTLTGSAYLNNTGKILASPGPGIKATGAVTVVNSGMISATGSAGILNNAASTLHVSNTGTGLISGSGVGVYAQSATISNSGTIKAIGTSAIAVFLSDGSDGGSINNSGLITATRAGIYFAGTGTVTNTNSGTIKGGSYGLRVNNAGSIDNSGMITADTRLVSSLLPVPERSPTAA